MNCCDDFGKCSQGRDCPVRECASAPSEYVDVTAFQTPAFAWWMLVLTDNTTLMAISILLLTVIKS